MYFQDSSGGQESSRQIPPCTFPLASEGRGKQGTAKELIHGIKPAPSSAGSSRTSFWPVCSPDRAAGIPLLTREGICNRVLPERWQGQCLAAVVPFQPWQVLQQPVPERVLVAVPCFPLTGPGVLHWRGNSPFLCSTTCSQCHAETPEETLFSGDLEHEESDSNSGPLIATQIAQTCASVIRSHRNNSK